MPFAHNRTIGSICVKLERQNHKKISQLQNDCILRDSKVDDSLAKAKQIEEEEATEDIDAHDCIRSQLLKEV